VSATAPTLPEHVERDLMELEYLLDEGPAQLALMRLRGFMLLQDAALDAAFDLMRACRVQAEAIEDLRRRVAP
jgi:hypothetical protein